MEINDHIAAIKEHLKAIEAEKQPKSYLVIPTNKKSVDSLLHDDIFALAGSCLEAQYLICLSNQVKSLKNFIRSGKIITVNEE